MSMSIPVAPFRHIIGKPNYSFKDGVAKWLTRLGSSLKTSTRDVSHVCDDVEASGKLVCRKNLNKRVAA